MFRSSAILPRATSASAAIAETDLLIEAAWKSVASVAAESASASARP